MTMKDLINIFVDAMNRKQMVMVRFKARSDGKVLIRKCASLDIAPSKRAKMPKFKFHFWDFDKSHVLSLEAEQVIEIYIIEETFRPEEFVTWKITSSSRCIACDLGRFS